MTHCELLAAVDSYFLTHLDSEFWSNISKESKAGAVNMAFDDVLSELPGVLPSEIKPGSFAFKAVAEQAVYLARNYESLQEGKVVTSESVEGISNSYTLISDKIGLSFRASAFINKAKSIINGGSVRVARG